MMARRLVKQCLFCTFRAFSQAIPQIQQQRAALMMMTPKPIPELIENGLVLCKLFASENLFEDHENAARDLLEIVEETKDQSEVLRAKFRLAQACEMRGKYREAREICEEVLSSLQLTAKSTFLIEVTHTLAILCYNLNLMQVAKNHIQTCISLLQTSGKDDDFLSSVYCTYGLIAAALGEMESAESYLLKALKMKKEASDVTEVGTCLHHIASLYLQHGRNEEAESVIKEKAALESTLSQTPHLETAQTDTLFGSLCESRGQHDIAKSHYIKALETRKLVLKSAHPLLAQAHLHLSNVCLALKQGSEAQSHCSAAADIANICYPANHPFFAALDFDQGMALDIAGKPQEALQCVLKAYNARCQHLPPLHITLCKNALAIGDLYLKLKQFKLADQFYRKGYQAMKTLAPKNHPDLAAVLLKIASVNYASKKISDAEESIREALAIRIACYGQVHHMTMSARLNLGTVLLTRKKFSHAETELRQYINWIESAHEKTPVLVSRLHAGANLLHTALQQQGKTSEADAVAKRFNLEMKERTS